MCVEEMRRNVLFVGGILLVIGFAVILHRFLILQEVSGHNPVSVNRTIREQAYSEFAMGIILACVGPLLWFVYGRSPKSKHI